MKVPDESHPITIEPTAGRVVVRVGESVVADTTSALTLKEADYPPVQYLPFDDVAHGYLRRSNHHTHCPYKGEASYYDLVVEGREIPNAIWAYEDPYPATAQIKGHVAFYPQHVSFSTE